MAICLMVYSHINLSVVSHDWPNGSQPFQVGNADSWHTVENLNTMKVISIAIFYTTIIIKFDLSYTLFADSLVKSTVDISAPSYISFQPHGDGISKAPLDHVIHPYRTSETSPQSWVLYESFAGERIPMNTLVRKKRQEPSGTTLFMDYIVVKQLHETLTALQKLNIMKLNNTLPTMILDILDEYVVKTEFYLLLTKKIEDEIGACDFLATPQWWRIKITVPDTDNKVRILDLMLETILRYYYRWLCQNNYIITEKSPNELAAMGLEITKAADFYRILTEGENEITDFEKNLSRHNWWLQEGEIDVENGELVWTT